MISDKFEKILKAFANKRRLTILKYLKENKEKIVGEIAEAIKLSFKSTSRHLNILASVEILGKEQRNTQVFYFLKRNQVSLAEKIISFL